MELPKKEKLNKKVKAKMKKNKIKLWFLLQKTIGMQQKTINQKRNFQHFVISVLHSILKVSNMKYLWWLTQGL